MRPPKHSVQHSTRSYIETNCARHSPPTSVSGHKKGRVRSQKEYTDVLSYPEKLRIFGFPSETRFVEALSKRRLREGD